MFTNLGQLKYLTKDNEIKISFNQIKSGINFLEQFIIYKNNSDIKIYNRICDHAGGKIVSKDGMAICPVHMWKFNPSTGHYDNGVKKKSVEYLIDKNFIKINDISYIPEIDKSKKKLNTEIRFFNHAFLKVTSKTGKIYWIDPTNNVSMATGVFSDIANKMVLILDSKEPAYERSENVDPRHSERIYLRKLEIIDDKMMQ